MSENSDKKGRLLRMIEMFGSRRVFVFYMICLLVTVGTMITSVVRFFVPPNNLMIERVIEHFILCTVGLAFLSVPVIMHRKYNFQIPWFITIAVAFLITSHFVLGEVYRFYDHVFAFDKLLHITGGLVIAACGFSIVYGFSKGSDGGLIKLPPFFIGMFSFCFALALLVLWEILEYNIDANFGYNMQRWQDGFVFTIADGVKQFAETEVDGVKCLLTDARHKQGTGLIDTMRDLIVGTIGAAIVSIIGGMWFRKNPDNTKFLIMRKKAPGEKK